MKRRTLIRQMGAAGVATAALAGPTAADSSELSLDVGRDLEVSSISGRVPLEQLLEPQDLDHLPDRLDPQEATILVDDDADVITLDACCEYCAKWLNVCDCEGGCCTLTCGACPSGC